MTSRAILAFVGLFLTFGLAGASWWASSSVELDDRIQRVRAQPDDLARNTASRLAMRAAMRLEAAREIEERLPPHADRFPLNPLVRARFRITGERTIVTLRPSAGPSEERLRAALLSAAGTLAGAAISGFDARLSDNSLDDVRNDLPFLESGSIRWRAVPLDGTPHLVGIRSVATPAGRVYTGFVVDLERLVEVTSSVGLASRLAPGFPLGPGSARIPIAGTPWRVDVDVESLRERNAQVVADLERSFRKGAIALLTVALLGCVLVAVLVGQAERIALERSRFAASAAHELRTPLAGIRMYGEMLAEGLGDPANRTEYARRLASEAARLGRVVSNVLGFSRLERGRLSVRPAPGDAAHVLRESIERITPAVQAAGASLSLTFDEPIPVIPFDRDAFEQIVQNLVDNAEKYGRGASNRSIEVRLSKCDPGLELSVRDHGPGIPARDARRLFRPFRRLTKRDDVAGLGLGLALVRALARGHGGDIRYEAAEGGGARFRVTFPG